MRETIYRGRIVGLDVYRIKRGGRHTTREIVRHPGAAAVMAFDENDRLLLVRQLRHTVGEVLEIPAGTLEKNESPRDCARRELLEETGYSAKTVKRLVSYYPSIGYNTEIIHCFVAGGVKKISGRQMDEDEIMSVVPMKLDRVAQKIRSGAIKDSKTICAVMTYLAQKR